MRLPLIQELPSKAKINPFKPCPSEILPLCIEQNFSGFLIDGGKLQEMIEA